MTRPVSVVIPSLDTRELIAQNLPPLLEELAGRALDDEVIVVDDTGEGALASWVEERFADVVVVARRENGGFARALCSGVEAARHELVFSMNTDVRIRPGFLDPLVACMQDENVFAVAPRVLLEGEEGRIESVTAIRMRRGFAEFHQRALADDDVQMRYGPSPIAFAVGGTCLLRRDAFLTRGGFDPMYEPFYWEDIDLCWQAWRSGEQVLYQPASVVEHYHRGTIARIVDDDVVRAAIEKNRYLFQWKHLDTPRLLEEHVAALHRRVVDAWLGGERDELLWLNLALDQLEDALEGRSRLLETDCDFAEILRRSTPSS